MEKVEVRVITGATPLTICFGLHCPFPPVFDHFKCEDHYQKFYKPLLSALYALPKLPFTLSMTGTFIEWIERHHAEYFIIINEMIARKQIDVIGGGFYEPLFPLIPPVDRVGQIELLTTAIRKTFGKRPRGAWLPASAWDPVLISSLTTCGIEYVLLDRILIESAGFAGIDGYAPVTLEDGGKTVVALPLDNQYRYLERYSPQSFFDQMKSLAETESPRALAIFVDYTSIPALFADGDGKPHWFESLVSLIGEDSGIELSHTARALKGRGNFPRAYVSPGMSPFDIEWPSNQDDIRLLSRMPVKRFLVDAPDILNLYAKMTYVHSLVNQLRGDRSRKNNAREELWISQYREPFLPQTKADPQRFRALFSHAYKNLLIAEKTSRLKGVFTPSINALDFDMDGTKEYLCQLDRINAYVHAKGGKIFELDVLDVNRNYCDVSCETPGFFIDHFAGAEDVERLAQDGRLPTRPVFAETQYQELSLEASRNEVQLKANGLFGSFQQPLSLRKQYNFRDEGIQVQCILKNESPLNLSGAFLIEFAPALTRARDRFPIMSVYAHDARRDGPFERVQYDDVAWVRIKDSVSDVTFTLEPNENASLIAVPLACGGYDTAKLYLHWKVDLSPGFETEKTVFLKIDG